MTSDRKKPGVAFWATVVVVALPIVYVASFGPATWYAWRQARVHGIATGIEVLMDIEPIYAPLEWTRENGPEWWKAAMDEYEIFWCRRSGLFPE